MSDIERIEDSKDKNQAVQYLRVALKNALPILRESTDLLTEEISQLKLSVSIQRDTVDIHKAKVLKQAQLIKDSSNDEDTDLTTPVEELQETLHILKGEYVTLDTAYKQDLTKLDVLTNRLFTLVRGTSPTKNGCQHVCPKFLSEFHYFMDFSEFR